MSRISNKISWLAWLWFGIMVIVILVNLPENPDLQGGLINAILAVLDSLILLAFPLVGTLIVSRQPQNTIGWLLMVPSFLVPVDLLTRTQIIGVTIPPAHPSIFFWIAVYLSNTTWLFAIFPVFFIALLFPTGKPQSPRWRWVMIYAISLIVFFFVIAFFDKTLAPDSSVYGVDWSIPNPLGFLDTSKIDSIFSIWFAGLIALALICVVSIILRYRHASGVERKQINWLLYAISLFGIFYIPYMLFQAWGTQIWGAFVDLWLIAIPLAIGVAILRYRLWDIDLIIRKTLLYSGLTGALGLVYFGSVLLLQQVFHAISGQQSPAAVVFSTLVIVVLFNPMRQRLQIVIDRRFFRQKYDAEKTLADFNASLRQEVNLEKMSDQLLAAVVETVQPEHVSLWRKSEADRHLFLPSRQD